jgi:hypothetical protein
VKQFEKSGTVEEEEEIKETLIEDEEITYKSLLGS